MIIGFPSTTISYSKGTIHGPEEMIWEFDTYLPFLAEKYGQDIKLARSIINCESQSTPTALHKNLKDGIHWSSDWGYWQINDYWHHDGAKRLGFDIKSNWKDNLEYGFILLSQDGAAAHWSASSHCWDK